MKRKEKVICRFGEWENEWIWECSGAPRAGRIYLKLAVMSCK